MAYRSEQNKIANKINYTDLPLSQYPNTLDTRTNNTNMRGFVNVEEGQIPDFVMAEYVNAALDGLMSVERALGTTPMVPFDAASDTIPNLIESSSVSDRLKRIEDGLFDERYGGAGWRNVANRPTLNNHSHDGLNGHPGKIHLINEVEGILQKDRLNLTLNSGVTGADIYTSKTNPVFIDEAINDSLSKSKGGTVTGPVAFKKGHITRTTADFTADELTSGSGATLLSNNEATSGRVLQLSGTSTVGTLANITASTRSHMLYGKYILAARIRLTTNTTGAVLRFTLGSQTQTILGSELTVGGYKQIYFVYDQNSSSKNNDLIIQKLATTSTATVQLDNVFIQPIHPAVLDR